MRKNPVLENEMKRYTRNMKCAWIILGVNLVLGLFALIAQMGLSGRENYMTILQYRFPIQCYVLMGYGLFLAICILIPGLAGGAIAGERERKTLDLLLTTHLSPWKIILGKLFLCLTPERAVTAASFQNIHSWRQMAVFQNPWKPSLFIVGIKAVKIDAGRDIRGILILLF